MWTELIDEINRLTDVWRVYEKILDLKKNVRNRCMKRRRRDKGTFEFFSLI
jgi:hypothetical protein